MRIISKAELILWIIGGAVIFFASILIPLLLIGLETGSNFELDFKAQVDSSTVNGILTADAVIFGFITFELRRISNRLKMATFVFALPLIGLLMTTVSSYFVDGVVRGYATIYTLIWATITFFYIILHYVYLTAFIKRFNVEID